MPTRPLARTADVAECVQAVTFVGGDDLLSININDTYFFVCVRQHVVEVEDGQETPIMEIREWLDESGKQTSVDVTDLGKVRELPSD